MKAARVPAENEFPRIEEIPAPAPGRGEALVRVAYAGINYADTMMRRGFYLQKASYPFIPGFEFSGTVEAVGEGADAALVGQPVMGFGQGAYAECATAPAAALMPVPRGFSLEQAAAYPVNFLTAHAMLRLSARAQPGETLLVHAAGGGVGTAAVQLAKHLGLKVIGTASSDEKLARVTALGADHAINYAEGDYVPAVLEATGGRGADVIFEPNGGDQLNRDVACAAPFGRVVLFGMASGDMEPLDLQAMFKNSVTVAVFWMFTLSHEPQAFLEVAGELQGIVESTEIRPVIGAVYPLEQAAEALRALESRGTYGKLLLRASTE